MKQKWKFVALLIDCYRNLAFMSTSLSQAPTKTTTHRHIPKDLYRKSTDRPNPYQSGGFTNLFLCSPRTLSENLQESDFERKCEFSDRVIGRRNQLTCEPFSFSFQKMYTCQPGRHRIPCPQILGRTRKSSTGTRWNYA